MEKIPKNGYTLSRQWFDFVFQSSKMVTPIHTALYFWIIDLCNRLAWKDVFGLPTGYSMEAIGLKSYRSYKKALDDLIRWGFIELRAKSFNQHSSNQIALVLKAKAEAKADEVALVFKANAEPKQRQKQSSHNKTIKNSINSKNFIYRERAFHVEVFTGENVDKYGQDFLIAFFNYWSEKETGGSSMRFEREENWETDKRLARWETRKGSSIKKDQRNDDRYL